MLYCIDYIKKNISKL